MLAMKSDNQVMIADTIVVKICIVALLSLQSALMECQEWFLGVRAMVR
jgi:hypothetical protein